MNDYLRSEFSQSGRNLNKALRLAEAGNNTFEIQHAREALALNYSKLGELEQALSYASKMLNNNGLYYQSRNQWFRDKGTLAGLSLKLKFLSTAFSTSTEKLSVAKETLSLAQEMPPSVRHVSDALRSLVFAAFAKKDYEAALKYAADSMQLALEAKDSPENTRTKGDIHRLVGDVKSQKKDFRDALTEYDHALELYSRIPELTSSLYQIHKGKLFCFQQLNDEARFAGELETVLSISEKYRNTIREDKSRQAFFANERDVFDAAAESAIHQREIRRAFAFVEDSKARSLLEFVQSGKSIVEVEENFASIAHHLSVDEIQSRLPEQVQLIQYAVLPDKLAIWVMSRSRFDLIEKQITAEELDNKIETYQASIAGKTPPGDIRRIGKELYELLIPPGLVGDKQLCLIPDKSLHHLAFAALISRDDRYLLEDYALFYSPSASVLVLATENARSRQQVTDERLLSIGNPDFDREENPRLPDLHAAEAEAKAVAGDYQSSLALIGVNATKAMFLRNFASVEVVHFAGHFVANHQSPANSKLLFAGGDLRTSELAAYTLPAAKLMVLSACQTAFERYDKSEGAIGIARTLLALGAPVVVASHWQVDSEPTRDLMIAFHRNRKLKGLTSAESLRRAQLELLGTEKANAPFYWAAFVLFGGYANY
jgi:CHAT domain-containing protein